MMRPVSRADGLGILYILGLFPDYSETFILREIVELRRRGHRIRICSLRRPREPVLHGAAARLMKDVEYCPGWSRLSAGSYERAVAGAAAWIAERAAAHRVDLLHAHFSNLPASVARVAARFTGLPYTVTAHASDIYVDNPRLGWNLAGASLVVACNRRNAAYLRRRFPRLRREIAYAYHGLDLREFPDPGPRPEPTGPLRMLLVARLEPVKGVDRLLEACALLRRRGVRLRARVVGDGSQRAALRRRAAELGLGGTVAFLGALPQERLRREFRRAHVLVQPSVVTAEGQFDNLPNSVLEAMALRVPVVVSRIGALPEAVRNGWNGLLTAPGDVEGLARALESLRGRPGKTRLMTARARRTIAERYDIRKSPLPRLLEAALRRRGP